ncbi:NADPH dehydrogenase [subsurface metagenome]
MIPGSFRRGISSTTAEGRKAAAGSLSLRRTAFNSVCENGLLAHSQLGLWSDDHIGGLAKIAKACHEWGAPVLVQIHHGGYTSSSSIASPALAPSDYRDESKHARAMSLEEIRETQEAFVAAARRAKQAGCDGVELHGAHGFLLSQFMSPLANRRKDQYGGDLTDRTTFIREIIERLKYEVKDDDFVLGYRMGGNEPGLKEGIEIARILEAAGVELLHDSSKCPNFYHELYGKH